MTSYGYNITNGNLAIEKAKNKKDGVYSLRGFLYRVKDKIVTHIAYRGEIIQRWGILM